MVTPEDIVRIVDPADLPVPKEALQIDTPLVAQGFDSLHMATLMVEVESTYKKLISAEQTARLRTIRDIADFLNM